MKIKLILNCWIAVFLFNLFLFCNYFSAMGQMVDYKWAIRMGGKVGDVSHAIAVGASGNKYITGSFGDTADFDPGAGIVNLSAPNSQSMVIAKYDDNGNYVWAKAIGGTIGINGITGKAIALDTSENIYVTGYFQGTADFDPGLGVANLTSTTLGAYDIFIAKYDAKGNYIWAKNVGNTSPGQGVGITIDNSGNVIVTGVFGGTVDFDPGAGTANLTAGGGGDFFLAKYTSAGNYVWAINAGGGVGTPNDAGYDLVTDNEGNIYVTGYFYGIADFDPGVGVANISSNYTGSGFLVKYTSAGKYVWAGKIGGPGQGICLQAGHIYVTGYFSDVAADFNPSLVDSNGLVNRGAVNTFDIYLAAYNTDGKYLWAKNMGSKASDQGASIAVHPSGYLYITGYFQDTADFDPGPDSAKLGTAGSIDIFIAAYDTLGKYVWAKRIGEIGQDWSYDIAVDAARRVYITGQFNSTCDFDPGVGTANLTSAGSLDAFVLMLATKCSVSSTQEGGGCGSYTLNGKTYTGSGNYTQIFPLANGCDSIVTLKLTLNNKETSLAITACKSYTFNTQIYSATGVYKQTFTTALNCDSVVTLYLTINPAPTATVSTVGKVLTAGRADTYQWINCNGNTAIAGATSQTYTANQNGRYAVVVTVNGCSDTSDCVQVGPASVSELENENAIVCYPNPAKDKLNIDAKTALKNADIRLVNVVGQYVLAQRNQNGTHFTLDISPYTTGIYFCEIVEGGNVTRLKVIKE